MKYMKNVCSGTIYINTNQKDANLPPFTVVLQHHISPHSLISVENHADKPTDTTIQLPCYEALKM
jgi:hypothetical protein